MVDSVGSNSPDSSVDDFEFRGSRCSSCNFYYLCLCYEDEAERLRNILIDEEPSVQFSDSGNIVMK